MLPEQTMHKVWILYKKNSEQKRNYWAKIVCIRSTSAFFFLLFHVIRCVQCFDVRVSRQTKQKKILSILVCI